MRIMINGQMQEYETPISVMALAQALHLNLRQVAIERNCEIVSKSTYGDVMLAEGDKVEVVAFVGGG